MQRNSQKSNAFSYKKSVFTTFEKVVKKALNIIEKSLELEGIEVILEYKSKKELKKSPTVFKNQKQI